MNSSPEQSLTPSRRPTLIAILCALLGLAAIGGVHHYLTRPDPIRVLFAEKFPRWQLKRATGGISPGSAELAAMQKTIRAYPDVSNALAKLDAAFPDAAAVKKTGDLLSDALFDSHLPYYVNPQPIRDSTVLLSYQVVGESTWTTGKESLRVRRLSRLDRINIEMGATGQTDGERAVVFLDRIESQLVLALLAAADKKPKSARERPLTSADQAALGELLRVLAAKVGQAQLDTLTSALLARETAFETMRSRLHGGKLVIEKPDSFSFGESWFETIWPLSSLDRVGGPLLLDTDLRALEVADSQLRSAESVRTIDALLDVLALNTEAHEARHALDALTGRTVPKGVEPATTAVAPSALIELISDPRFIPLADSELRAYLGELHDAPSSRCLIFQDGIRQVRGRYVAHTPHFFAHYLLLSRLGSDENLSDPVAVVHRLCAEPDQALQSRVATLWKELYGTDITPLRREQQPAKGISGPRR